MKKEKNSIYSFLKTIFGFLLKIAYNPTILGRENIPNEGPVILAGNHKHSYDPILAIMSTKRVVHFLAKKELFKGLQGKILSKAGIISVDRSHPNPGVVKKSINILENGGVIGIFPEGTRNKTEKELLPFKYGAVTMAEKTNSPIVPFAIRGKYKIFGKELVIEFGKPIMVNNIEIENANNYLRAEILNLLHN